jgi:hypothetical protein
LTRCALWANRMQCSQHPVVLCRPCVPCLSTVVVDPQRLGTYVHVLSGDRTRCHPDHTHHPQHPVTVQRAPENNYFDQTRPVHGDWTRPSSNRCLAFSFEHRAILTGCGSNGTVASNPPTAPTSGHRCVFARASVSRPNESGPHEDRVRSKVSDPFLLLSLHPFFYLANHPVYTSCACVLAFSKAFCKG